MLISTANQHCFFKNKNKEQSESSLTNSEVQKSGLSSLFLLVTNTVINSKAVKWWQSIKNSNLLNHDTKCLKHSQVTQQLRLRLNHCKEDFINNWLSEVCWSQSTLTVNETLLQELSDNMFYKPVNVLFSSDNSFNSVVSFFKKFEKFAASMHDMNYRDFLHY